MRIEGHREKGPYATPYADVDLDAVAAGDLPAIRRWIEQLAPRMYLWAGSRLSPALRRHFDAEDATQEILTAIYRDLPRIGPKTPDGLLPWAYTVAENRIRDLAKYVGRDKRSGTPPQPDLPRTPSSILSRREELDLLLDALETLPDDHREVIRLRRFEELSTREAAARMSRTEQAIRSLYHRATRALAERLE